MPSDGVDPVEVVMGRLGRPVSDTHTCQANGVPFVRLLISAADAGFAGIGR